MKKILGMMLIAGSLIACDNSGSNTNNPDSTGDTSGSGGSTITTPPVTPDTANGATIDTANGGTTGSTTGGTTGGTTGTTTTGDSTRK